MNIDVALAILLGDGLDAGFTELFDLVGIFAKESLPAPKLIVWVPSSIVAGLLAGDLTGELVFMGEPSGRAPSSRIDSVSADFLIDLEDVRLRDDDGNVSFCVTAGAAIRRVRENRDL